MTLLHLERMEARRPRIGHAGVLAFILLLTTNRSESRAQISTTIPASTTAASVERDAAGDVPVKAGPLATDLSPALETDSINAAMTRVVAWELRTRQATFNRQWTYAALYDGLLAASTATANPAGHDAVLTFSEKWQWRMEDSRFPHADDEAIGQAYL